MKEKLTKKEELGVLDSTINQLGADSYLGPWLQSVRYEVEQFIRSDIFPQVSVRESVSQALAAGKAITDQAQVEANKLIKDAQKIKSDTLKEASSIRGRLQIALRDAEKTISE